MKRFFAKIGRFFWSRGFLKFILWTVTLVILFYVEEDWRGASAWAATKAKWEAQGETLDYSKFFPPPIPDDENLAAIPLFKLDPYPNTKDMGVRYLITLQKAMRSGLPGNDLPNTGNWMCGEVPDMEKIRSAMTTNFTAAFKDVTPPPDTLAQFDALYPFLNDLRAASTTRPLCRFNVNYAFYPPMSRGLGFLMDQIKLTRLLTVHGLLALDRHQPELALEDIKITYKLLLGVQRDPSLIGGLIAIGMNAIDMSVIYNGLAQHAWSDAQLVEIDHILRQIDFLADYQFAIRSEVGQAALDTDYIKHAPRSEQYGYLFGFSESGIKPTFWNKTPSLWPGGWWDQNKRQEVDILFHSVSVIDPKKRQVFPGQVKELEDEILSQGQRKFAQAPWNVLFTIMIGPVASGASKFAYAQDWIDEARIACALERYRIVHGAYPSTLDGLAPAYIDEVPHDIINGEPLHYQLRPDGMFLLYSVGWNQVDDGGKIAFGRATPASINHLEGDWVWATPQVGSQKPN